LQHRRDSHSSCHLDEEEEIRREGAPASEDIRDPKNQRTQTKQPVWPSRVPTLQSQHPETFENEDDTFENNGSDNEDDAIENESVKLCKEDI
jgi:hypothetical protein